MATLKKKVYSDLIKEAREAKNDSLNSLCQEAIFSGFPSNQFGSTYYFSYDEEAQANILDTMRLFENNMIDEITWNGRLHSLEGKRVRMTLTKEEFYQLYMDSVKHKMSCISKYRDDLSQLLEEAKTIEEIEAINWDSVEKSTFEVNLKSDSTIEKTINALGSSVNQVSRDNDSLTMALFDVVEMIMGGMI